MSYRLETNRRVADEVRRVVREQVDKAAEQLMASGGNRDDAIHQARVCFKKIRAVLRLTRGPLKGGFERENVFYRDLGRRLSSARNNAAMLEAFAKLTRRYSDQLAPGAFSGGRRPFVIFNAQRPPDKSKATAEVGRAVRAGRVRIRDWPLGNDGFGTFAPGLIRTYRQGRRRFRIAQEDSNVRSLHEWRKRVKDLWYEIRLLKKVWPGEMRKLARELEKLGDYLSDHHDLALLREAAADRARETNDERPEIETFVALIDERQAELRLEATLLGERVYAEKPAAFAKRFRCYWQAWCAETDSWPVAVPAREPGP